MAVVRYVHSAAEQESESGIRCAYQIAIFVHQQKCQQPAWFRLPDEWCGRMPEHSERRCSVSDMHCDHCVKSVTEAIDKIEGASAKVNLKKEEAVVSYDREIDDDDLKKAVEEAGFKVVDIRA